MVGIDEGAKVGNPDDGLNEGFAVGVVVEGAFDGNILGLTEGLTLGS